MPNDEFPAPSRSILLQVAAWWGFVAGLIEGIGLLVLQHYKNVWKGVSLEIILISAFLNLFFLLVGLVLAWVSNPIPGSAEVNRSSLRWIDRDPTTPF